MVTEVMRQYSLVFYRAANEMRKLDGMELLKILVPNRETLSMIRKIQPHTLKLGNYYPPSSSVQWLMCKCKRIFPVKGEGNCAGAAAAAAGANVGERQCYTCSLTTLHINQWMQYDYENPRKCDACGIAVELVSDCSHLMCTCRHSMCYVCGGKYDGWSTFPDTPCTNSVPYCSRPSAEDAQLGLKRGRCLCRSRIALEASKKDASGRHLAHLQMLATCLAPDRTAVMIGGGWVTMLDAVAPMFSS